MALNPDDYFGDAAVKPAGEAAPSKPRYQPAPTTQEGADARLSEVPAAEEEIRAWAESKRQKKAGGKAPAPAAEAPAPAPAAERKPLNPDDYFEADPPPPAPKKPGMLARAGEFLSAGRSKPDPSLSGVTKEQAAGMLPPEEAAAAPPAAPVEGEQQSLARQPGEADTSPLAQRRRNRFAENDPRRVDRAFNPGPKGSVLDKPGALDYPAMQDMAGRNARDQAAGSVSPERAAREQEEATAEFKGRRSAAEAKPLELTNEISTAIREATKNPAARGVVSGLSEMGKVGTGAVRLLSDVMGADALAEFARKSERRAGAVSQGATQDLQGNDKLAADIFSSVVSSAPSLAMGVAGAGQRAALNTLMVQTTMQEYGAGRDAGFGVGESLSRAMIMGYAERLGEQFDFMPQVKALKSLAKGKSSEEMARLFGEVLVKNVPGEELTTTVQFLADKLGPAALNPNADMGDYLHAVGETFKVAVGQSLLMGGGPAAINIARNKMGRADQVRGMTTAEVTGQLQQRDLEHFVTPKGDLPPTEARGAALKRFDELAAQFGFSPKAVARAKEAAGSMPAADVPSFLAKLAGTLQGEGLAQKPIDEASLRTLRQTIDAAEAETGAPQKSAPDTTEGAADGEQAEEEAQGLLKDAPADVTTAGAQDYTGLDETLDNAAHQAATSPLNDRPEPTDAQKEAGNYAKGHVRISGLDVSIENPKGSIRRSKADAPTPWEVTMPGHYGYIRGSTGADGDHVDLFIGDKGDTGDFWVINQNRPDGTFDEHKVVTGVATAAEASDLYRRSFKDSYGDQLIGSISQRMDAAQLKALLPDMRKAAAVHTPKATNDLQQPDLAATPAAPAAAPAAGGDQPGGSGGTVGPVSAAPAGVVQPADAPEGRNQPPAPAAAAPAADPALTDIPALKRAWAKAAAEGNTEEARRLNDLIVAAKASQQPPAPAPAPAPAPEAPAAPAPRVIGRHGRTPKASTEIELRPNADGTWTPFEGKYEMLDYQSGDPIVLPAGVTDAQAAAAIRAAGAVTKDDKFYGVKPDPAPESMAAPAPSSVDGASPGGDGGAVAPGAATLPTNAERLAAAEKRLAGLKALLKCLQT